MINGKSISVLITTYCRYKTLPRVVAGWLAQPVDQVWVLDGGGKARLGIKDPRLLVFNMPRDLGTKMDYVFALLTNGDVIILADDDVIVKRGFAEELEGYRSYLGGIVGVLGRTFHGPTYKGDTKFYTARAVQAPVRVGFAGVIMTCERELFGFDVRGLQRNCDDLWFQMKVHPEVQKHVVPTTKYENTPEGSDATAMYKNPKLKEQRQIFYANYYNSFYRPKGLIY